MVKFKVVKQALFLNLFFIATTAADVWVFGINGTITIKNDVDLEKTPTVETYRIVAQNTFLQKESTVSIETHIKRTIKDKSQQRSTYEKLPDYAKKLYEDGLISIASYNEIPKLINKYENAIEEVNSEIKGYFFPSFFKLINYILQVDKKPIILIQSFGNEIPSALSIIAKRFPGKLTIEKEIGIFDKQNQLYFKDKVYQTPAEMEELLIPFTVRGWKNNYHSNGGKILFFRDTPQGFLRSHYYVDNANSFDKVAYNGSLLSVEEGFHFAKPYIYQVDTGKALSEPDYFIKLHSNLISTLSYNIQLSGLDNSPHLWTERANPVISKLQQYDLLMIQELSHSQFMDIQDRMRDYDFISVNSITGNVLSIEAGEKVEGMAIGFNRNLFSLIEPSHFWLSDTPHTPSKTWEQWTTTYEKILQRVVLKHLSSEKRIAVYNSHFCHEEDPDKQINPRLKSAQLEIEKIVKDLENGLHVISGGDRNTHLPRDQDTIKLYQKDKRLNDVDSHREGLATTFIGFEGHPRMNPNVNGKFRDSMNLDKVFYSNAFSLIQSVVRSGRYDHAGQLVDISFTEGEFPDRRYASDHAGVASFFQIK